MMAKEDMGFDVDSTIHVLQSVLGIEVGVVRDSSILSLMNNRKIQGAVQAELTDETARVSVLVIETEDGRSYRFRLRRNDDGNILDSVISIVDMQTGYIIFGFGDGSRPNEFVRENAKEVLRAVIDNEQISVNRIIINMSIADVRGAVWAEVIEDSEEQFVLKIESEDGKFYTIHLFRHVLNEGTPREGVVYSTRYIIDLETGGELFDSRGRGNTW